MGRMLDLPNSLLQAKYTLLTLEVKTCLKRLFLIGDTTTGTYGNRCWMRPWIWLKKKGWSRLACVKWLAVWACPPALHFGIFEIAVL